MFYYIFLLGWLKQNLYLLLEQSRLAYDEMNTGGSVISFNAYPFFWILTPDL